MLIKYLKDLSKLTIDLIRGFKKIYYKWEKKYINLAVFKKEFSWNLYSYKKKFFENLWQKEKNINEIKKRIENDRNLDKNEKLILKNEIFITLKKIEFLKYSYDIEANKIDPKYEIKSEIKDYDEYNKLFYRVSKKDLINKTFKKKSFNIDEKVFEKEKLIELLEYTKKLVVWFNYKFWKYWNLSHLNWTLKIPNKNYYNLNNIIVIFFHEMTHLFRYINWKKNLWFYYFFTDYFSLEEWLAIYNEYLYWNKICDYWKYIPYYDLCYKIINENISENLKIEKIYNILRLKWFDRKKAKMYYFRFNKYSQIWKNDLFLKDLVYTKSYEIVKKYIKADENNYEKLMAWKIWINEFEKWILKADNNIDSKKYFQIILEKIKSLIN